MQSLRAGRILTMTILPVLMCRCTGPVIEDFTIIALPDTQFYVSGVNGGNPELFNAQTDWIVANRDSLNIVFVTHLGDCVQNGDSLIGEWRVVEKAMSRLEDPATTTLQDGIPYGVAPGNHDQSPEGSPDGTTTVYNWVFGEYRFKGREYYGGHFGQNNDNHYELFSAGTLDFIVIHLEYDMTPDVDVLAWADDLLQEHSDRRAILVTHYLIGDGYPAEFSPQGEAIYQALKENDKLFLVLGVHISGATGEVQRVVRPQVLHHPVAHPPDHVR